MHVLTKNTYVHLFQIDGEVQYDRLNVIYVLMYNHYFVFHICIIYIFMLSDMCCDGVLQDFNTRWQSMWKMWARQMHFCALSRPRQPYVGTPTIQTTQYLHDYTAVDLSTQGLCQHSILVVSLGTVTSQEQGKSASQTVTDGRARRDASDGRTSIPPSAHHC